MIDPAIIVNGTIIVIISIILTGAGALIWKRFRREKEREGKETIQRVKVDTLQLTGQDSLVKDTEIPKSIPDQKLEDIIEVHKNIRGDFVKINGGALKSVFRKNRDGEIFSIDLFHVLKILSRIINQYQFLPDEFKKPLVASIAWYRAEGFRKEVVFYKTFRESLNLTENERTIFRELNRLNRNDRVVFLLFPELEDLRKMNLTDDEKCERFRMFYDGLKPLAYEFRLDNLGKSNMIYVGEHRKPTEEIIEGCLKSIDSKIGRVSPDIIIEARGGHINTATSIAGTVLSDRKKNLMVGNIKISKHYYYDKPIGPKSKIFITLIKKDKVSDTERKYYDKKESDIFRLRDTLSKRIQTISSKGRTYTETELSDIRNNILECKTVLYKMKNIQPNVSDLHNMIWKVLETVEHYRDKQSRILTPFCAMSHESNPDFSIVLRWMGSRKTTDIDY